MDNVTVGDLVRSFDFEHSTECYVEGVVVEMGRFPEFPGCDRYKIACTKRVFGGEVVKPEDTHFFPPVNGTPTWGNRVTNCVKLVVNAD